MTHTGYVDDQHFRDKFKSNKNMSMFHLNIRSIPEHFIELTSYHDSLDNDFKIMAISETWLKLYHTEYSIPNYSIEKDTRFFKRGSGVSLYLHCSLQYKLRNDLKHIYQYMLIGRQLGMAVRMPTPINQLFNDESIAVQSIFLDDYTWN